MRVLKAITRLAISCDLFEDVTHCPTRVEAWNSSLFTSGCFMSFLVTVETFPK